MQRKIGRYAMYRDAIIYCIGATKREYLMVLELKLIEKSFGEKHVLKDVLLCVESGRSFGTLGRSGSKRLPYLRILILL